MSKGVSLKTEIFNAIKAKMNEQQTSALKLKEDVDLDVVLDSLKVAMKLVRKIKRMQEPRRPRSRKAKAEVTE